MRTRLVSGVLALGVATALVTVPVAPAAADPGPNVVVGPEALLTGSTGIRLTKEYETVAPAVPGFRSPADAVYVEGPTDTASAAAHGGSSLQLLTGAGKPNPNTNPAVTLPTLQGKDYVGRWFADGTPATTLTTFSFRALTPTPGGAAPYLNVEYYDAAAPAGQRYVNMVWTPGGGNPAMVPGVWTDYDTSTGWKTPATFITGIAANTPISLADAAAAIASDDHPLSLLRANVAWGDTAGGYANKSLYLDDLTLTVDGTSTTYEFDAPYSATCAAPAGGWVNADELADTSEWAVHTEYQPTITSTATATVAAGPTGAVGGASLVLASGPGTDVPGLRGYAGKVFVDRLLPGCTIGDLTSLGYRTFTASGQSGLAPYLNIDVALPGSATTAAESSILVWSPGDGGAPAPAVDAWSSWNPFTQGTWRVVRTITGSSTLTANSYYTWAQIQSAIPAAELPRGIQLVVGDSTYQAVPGAGWSNKTGQVDQFSVGIAGVVAGFDFGGPFGTCARTTDNDTRTITLTADCATAGTLYVPDRWTLDGAGHSIIATETPLTSFTGAVVQNAGILMHIRDLTVTTNTAAWDDPGKNSGGDLVGIRFLAAAGSLDDVTVDGISHGNGVQEGKGILVDNRTGAHAVQVSITGSTVINYQKNGIDVRGANALLELRDSFVGRGSSPIGEPLDEVTASNSVVVAYGANAIIDGNEIAGNDYDGLGDIPNTRDWSATGILLYQAGSTVISRNVVSGVGTDTGINSYDSSATITCNLVTRTADEPGRLDVWATGVWVEGGTASLAGNTITGFRTPINGGVSSGEGGCRPGALTVSSSVTGPRTADVVWGETDPLPYAPASSWEVSVDGVVSTKPAAVTDLALTGLAPGSTHQVSVRAVNGDGAGPWTATTLTTAAIPVPSAVSGLVASAITTTSATVDWSPSAVVGDGAVDSYEVSIDGVPQVVPAATVSRSLTGLEPGSTYAVVVRAHNESGWSDPASVSFTTNDLDRRTPGAPTLTVADPDEDGVVALSWTANAADSTDFPVQSWVVAVDGADEAFLPAGTTTYDVVGLDEGRHTVTVRGVNAVGSAAFASQVFVVESQNASLPTALLAGVPSTVVYGKATTLRGLFSLDGEAATDAVVTLWVRSGSTWTYAGTTATDDLGQFSFGVKPSRTTTYRAMTSGLPSAYSTVVVRPLVAVKALTSKAAGKKWLVRVSATVSPKLGGTTVRLQKLVGTTWKTVKVTTLSSTSSVVFRVGKVKKLTAKYRVAVAASASAPASTSTVLKVTVKKRR